MTHATRAGDIDRVFHDAIDIINDALHKDGTEGGSLAAQLPAGKSIGVAVFDSDPGAPRQVYRIRFDGERLAPMAPAAGAGVDCRLAQSHLHEVCDRQDDFLERPLECELVWMMARMAA